MKSRKELAELLKFALQDMDSDGIWYVIGELEKSE
jgi:hypothetical protein